MIWNKLINTEPKALTRGTVLRFPAKYPYEEIVDFMLFDPLKDDYGLGLLVATGYKAGLISVLLPKDSCGDYSACVDSTWLILNWDTWVYPECDVTDVLIADSYLSPVTQ